ncbi:hypothetical protein N177_0124 [Lutibaculum baratangense AMV1]|uniref:Uncharacterized protein n=2 Tax=Lutibaculum TaxID=1358438 RepID=V4RWP9_9HYPH|nr:hypothetical protein N177_0124 [Lutibaculum baratangense AMV1]
MLFRRRRRELWREHPAVLTFVKKLQQLAEGEGTKLAVPESAKPELLRAVYTLSNELGLAKDFELGDVEAAVERNSLPIWYSLLNLLRPVCDPATLHFPGNYDHNKLDHRAFLEMLQKRDEGVDLPLLSVLLAAGLAKFMGSYRSAEEAYKSIAGPHGLIGQGDLHASAALYERHLVRDERKGATVTAAYGIQPLLQEALSWPGMPEPSFARAEAFIHEAIEQAPAVPLGHYLLAVLRKLTGSLEEAETSLRHARGLVPAAGSAGPTLDLQLDRLVCARGHGGGVEEASPVGRGASPPGWRRTLGPSAGWERTR